MVPENEEVFIQPKFVDKDKATVVLNNIDNRGAVNYALVENGWANLHREHEFLDADEGALFDKAVAAGRQAVEEERKKTVRKDREKRRNYEEEEDDEGDEEGEDDGEEEGSEGEKEAGGDE